MVPAVDASHVESAPSWCIGAHGESISQRRGHLIWQLQEKQWACAAALIGPELSSKFFGLQALALQVGGASGSGGCQRGRGQLAPHRLKSEGSSYMDSFKRRIAWKKSLLSVIVSTAMGLSAEIVAGGLPRSLFV